MRVLDWDEFNTCVQIITSKCSDKSFCGVFGVPRGGLCLAVALSHSLEIPLLNAPRSGCLLVDDVYETGNTLRSFSEINEVISFVWFSKVKPEWWNAVELSESNEWIVFPWEKTERAESDQKAYQADRKALL